MEAYPYSLLGGSLAGSLGPVELGAVIPSAPDDQELSAAFRLVADAGRRLRGATLHITLVSVQQDSWLQTGHSPALLVGRVADLPGSVSLLTAAGFTAAGAGWIAPGATAPISADDGIVAAVISPWDGRSPMLLVTGGSDSAVTRAAAAVLDPRLGARGHAAVVSSVASVGSIEVPDVPFGTLLPRNLAIRGAGDHLIAFAVPEPAIGGGFSATVKLTVSAGHSSAAGASAPELTVEVSGRTVPAPAAAVTGAVVSRAVDIRPELRPGMNAVTVNLHLPEGADEVRLDAELSNSRPLQSQSASSLDQLPDPFLNAPPGTMPTVVLADLQPTTLAGAASAMAALGSRAVVAPAPLGVVILDRDGLLPRNAHSVIVIGGPAGQALRLRSGAFRTEVISPPAGPDSHSGWIAQVALPGGVPALWVGGDPLTLVATGVALADPQLSGHLAVVRLNGQARNVLGSNPGLDVEPFTIALAQLLPLVVGFLLLGVLAVEVGRRWRWAR
ncbi:MAG: cellulose biosynthesis cyclic di-GMP-binding regulatory protein BcsB [Candidatus Dormibacteraeota bacterium]|uniref:Cellulose biosynthesis cyclic di-GMP-binding regulatory protein BcsB n=1 Tax=Candidatus Aeolococcus gillhamiae TaxID=3127015 RepID=A0A934K0K7_9BACT|nr:cellulose biosynthesis cyclic di-GMP-binding regulatory protein BcsB [Candidatus Dormibacteraeota bacterium]